MRQPLTQANGYPKTVRKAGTGSKEAARPNA
jgi:hypothetical protein